MLQLWKDGLLNGENAVAVAIMRIDDSQRHCGIMHYNSDNEVTELLHLAWHCVLASGPPSAKYHIVKPALHPRVQRRLASRCRQIRRANGRGRIPYGFGTPPGAFSEETGEYLMGPTSHGLTCATFVLAVFEVERVPLAVYDSWLTPREGDAEWQRHILDLLRQHGADAEHLRVVERDIGNVRFRPEETAAAACHRPLPARFEDISQRALEMVAKLNGNAAVT